MEGANNVRTAQNPPLAEIIKLVQINPLTTHNRNDTLHSLGEC
ncbi:MAG TPA: hypothetical protein O0W91_00990 [Methanocorpusculum sp.]|nr:hypothetical protein [Methanocorpusculum sp.]HJK01833.1 hypothetical protein [Methanocorpusculum sp.]